MGWACFCTLNSAGGGGGEGVRLVALTSPCHCAAGTFVSAFAVLCGAMTDQHHQHVCVVFLLNVAAALIQLLTAVVIVGWIMSIFWGMDMVILASEWSQN